MSIIPSRRRAYDALRRSGIGNPKAAKIANAGKTHAERSRMAKKAARTRKRHGN